MYRLISASADTYITDKIIEGSRSLNANVGQGGTLDIYKLYDETEYNNQSNVIEISRGLIKFDYTRFSNIVAINSPNFTASVVLKNVYGGQTTPSNFTLALYPLSKAFDEGRGFDVASYKDIDTANFLKCSTGINWTVSGAAATGSLGETVDIIVSGNIGNGIEGLGSYCSFARGDEDAKFNITKIVSASLAGILPNHGFRLSFIHNEEQDTETRFVKRFGSKQALNKELHPKLVIEYDIRTNDTTSRPLFNVSQSFYVYNAINGNYTNFVSGAVDVLGNNCLIMELVSSKSNIYTTSSYQANFLQIIEHRTSSVIFCSRSFTGSKDSNNTGIYSCNFLLDSTDSEMTQFVSGRNEVGFDVNWKSLDGTIVFAKKFVKFKTVQGAFTNTAESSNYICNITNLKQEYSKEQVVRMKVFVQDRTNAVTVSRALEPNRCTTFSDMRWRLKKAYTNKLIVPFAPATRLSSDSENMYFDIYMEDLDINEVYEIEFIIKNDQGKDILVSDKGFTFKVIE